MIKLTETREITRYRSVHPDEETALSAATMGRGNTCFSEGRVKFDDGTFASSPSIAAEPDA
jgi:hypothetical protein